MNTTTLTSKRWLGLRVALVTAGLLLFGVMLPMTAKAAEPASFAVSTQVTASAEPALPVTDSAGFQLPIEIGKIEIIALVGMFLYGTCIVFVLTNVRKDLREQRHHEPLSIT
jgi:hypothetical protein